MANIEKANQLPARKGDLSEWYSQVLLVSDMIDRRYDFKGAFVWKSYGFKAMQNLKRMWDDLYQNAGIEELYFPLIVPIQYCKQNEAWWKNFETEGYKVIAGANNEIQGALRPTGEPAIYPMFSLWTRAKTDLPIRIYETVSSFRYETKHTRPLIRDREITVWHEIHTAHATREDAEAEMELHMVMWDEIWTNLAMPIFKVKKPQWECFPGAIGAIEYYSTTPDGRVMENGSCNNLGQAYSKKFNIKYTDLDGIEKYAWQICTGNGARLLAGALIVHGDDKGLVMPPKIAPFKAVIIPILFKDKEKPVLKKCKSIFDKLNKKLSIKFDERDSTAGSKFYDWEIKGVPIRIEVGPKDVEKEQVVLVRRDTNEKIFVKESELQTKLEETLEAIQTNLLNKSTDMLKSQLTQAHSLKDIKDNAKNGKISKVFWCNEGECHDRIGEIEDGLEGFGTDPSESVKGKCVVCGKDTFTTLFVAKTY
ncbi:MAG: aminoacyl--tRNA ligase-related protein [Candidatus Woesearchaeota archaeon]